MFVVESVSGGAPEKQTSAVCVLLLGCVKHPTLQAWESVQLFCVNLGPPEHLYRAPGLHCDP